MAEAVEHGTLIRVLDWTYDRAVNGVPGLASAESLAEEYLRHGGTLHDQVSRLIRWQNTKAAASGFLYGLGGVLTLPVTIPANITSVMYMQVRMIAAIAHMGGHDLRDDRVRTLVYACLCGNAAKDVVKELGIKIGTRLTEQAIRNISKETIIRVNQAVGFRLLTRFGQTGAINLGKAVPVVGGLISASFDTASTHLVGTIARRTFIPDPHPELLRG
jgi:uncharacterized protein (DUF697 family)